MTTHPLSGIRIPSIQDIVEQVMARVPEAVLDLRNPLQRRRMREWIEQAVGRAVETEMEQALGVASRKAIEHVFALMRDADYQDKKAKRREESRKRSRERREKREAAEREARMDYSKKRMRVEKETVQ